MDDSISILVESVRTQLMADELNMISTHVGKIPNAIEFELKRVRKHDYWSAEDVGILDYNYRGINDAENNIVLKYCINGIASQKHEGCEEGKKCLINGTDNCNMVVETLDIFTVKFDHNYLKQFIGGMSMAGAEKLLNFEVNMPSSSSVNVCNKKRTVLQNIFSQQYTSSLQNIFINSQVQVLLVYALDCLYGEQIVETNKIYQCKFLADEKSREAIIKAKEILIQKIGDPITIKELARKVATNECYLKKGFKEMFGMTIFEFYQGQRMEHAKYLLYEKGLNVTDVSSILGYSSISHFSTAFKKYTGLKPCELLVR